MKKWASKHEDAIKNAPKHFDFDWDLAMATIGINQIDEAITRRLLGYNTLTEYYDHFSCHHRLKDIKVPLLCLNAKDDPILNHISIPYQECMSNDNIILLITNTGGHVGWFHGQIRPKRWYPKPSIEFLNCIHHDLQKNR